MKKELVRLFLILAGVIVLVACNATGPKFESLSQPSNDSAIVYFVRPASSTLAVRSINISINGTPYAELTNGGYTIAELEPGKYEFEQSFNHTFGDAEALKHLRKISANLESGELYYVAFQASSEFGSGKAVHVPISTSPYMAVPIQVAFNLGFGFIEKQAAIEKLRKSRYEKPLSAANK